MLVPGDIQEPTLVLGNVLRILTFGLIVNMLLV